jgi:hypothetical protein
MLLNTHPSRPTGLEVALEWSASYTQAHPEVREVRKDQYSRTPPMMHTHDLVLHTYSINNGEGSIPTSLRWLVSVQHFTLILILRYEEGKAYIYIY